MACSLSRCWRAAAASVVSSARPCAAATCRAEKGSGHEISTDSLVSATNIRSLSLFLAEKHDAHPPARRRLHSAEDSGFYVLGL